MPNRRLIVLTRQFPFGKGESFCEVESTFWTQFDEVYLCPFQMTPEARELKRPFPDGIQLIDVVDLKTPRIRHLRKARLLIFILLHPFVWYEVIHVLLSGNPHEIHIGLMLRTMMAIDRELDEVIAALPKTDPDIHTVVYSYWFTHAAYAAIRLKKRLGGYKAATRAHGTDLYEELGKAQLLYRSFCVRNLDDIFCISQYGKDYLHQKYPRIGDKVSVRRLGTRDYKPVAYVRNTEKLCIVSCSYCIEVKRLDKIIDALALLSYNQNIQIEWTHYGGGVLQATLEQQAKRLLGERVHYNFTGDISNETLMQRYQNNPYDVFINVSSSEGIPVSIMEAMSFGIPAIATDVGGTKELVVDKETGFLLRQDFTVEELSARLQDIIQMSDENYFALRQRARCFWETYYSAQKNYSDLMNYLCKEEHGSK